MSPNESDIPNNTADMGLIKNNSCLVKVIEVEDQSMRTITTKEIDIPIIETVTNQSCNDNNGSSNRDTFFAESSATARVNVLNTTVGKYSVFFVSLFSSGGFKNGEALSNVIILMQLPQLILIVANIYKTGFKKFRYLFER